MLVVRPTIDLDEEVTGPERTPVVYLLDVTGRYEERILTKWLYRKLGQSPRTIRIRSSRRGRGADKDAMAELLESEASTFLIPARVLWLAPERKGTRSVRWSDLLKLGDPRDPRGLRPFIIKNFRRGRVTTIVGKGASVAALTKDHESSETVDSVVSYVTRRAWRALDLKERALRGNRYKTPSFVPEAIFSRRSFKEDVHSVGAETGMSPEEAERRAEKYLREIAATHSPMVIDLVANAIHKLYRQGYGKIRYSQEQVQEIAALGQEFPVVFLPSHRSNLDRLSLQFVLWENDLPPNHTAGGINLNFFPIGPLIRRTGVFFIRRSFRDNHLYKTVLQHYLDFLIEKRFNLEWYLEGGRSRSGRLLPPRMGLLQYVVDAQRRGKAEDVLLVPLSIAYDQIQDVPDYAREAQGGRKEKESVGWLFKAVRSMRQRYGDIHIRFGEPVSVSKWTGDLDSDESSLGVQKLAFEVMYRIGQATPVTPTAVVSIALLTAQGKAKTAEQLAQQCANLVRFIDERGIPTTESLDFADSANVAVILDWLKQNEYVSSHEALDRRVFWLTDDQMIKISYYRNMVVHYFLNRSIAEISLATIAEASPSGVSLDEFSRVALKLRDLLKFEFYFPEKDEFLERVSRDVEIDVPGWRHKLITSGPVEILDKLGDPVSRWALVPFLDAYQIVADELAATDGDYNEKKFLKAALDRARMYRIEDETISGESASQVLFKSALALARNGGLLEDGAQTERQHFSARVRDARAVARGQILR